MPTGQGTCETQREPVREGTGHSGCSRRSKQRARRAWRPLRQVSANRIAVAAAVVHDARSASSWEQLATLFDAGIPWFCCASRRDPPRSDGAIGRVAHSRADHDAREKVLRSRTQILRSWPSPTTTGFAAWETCAGRCLGVLTRSKLRYAMSHCAVFRIRVCLRV